MTADVMTTRTYRQAGGGRDGHSGLARRLESTTAKLKAWWAWHQAYKRTLRELEGLGSRELDDIGIARCDIPMIAMQSADQATASR